MQLERGYIYDAGNDKLVYVIDLPLSEQTLKNEQVLYVIIGHNVGSILPLSTVQHYACPVEQAASWVPIMKPDWYYDIKLTREDLLAKRGSADASIQ